MKRYLSYIFLGALTLIFAACQKDEEIIPTSFTNNDIMVNVFYTKAEITWDVTCNATIEEVIVQYDTDSTFSKPKEDRMEINKVSESKLTHYTCKKKIYSLSKATTYYLRFKAINKTSSFVSDKHTFTTKEFVKATIQTDSITSLTTTSAKLHATLLEWGSDTLPQVGFYYAKHPNVTTADSCVLYAVKKSQDTIPYSHTLINLDDNTTYYAVAFAKNHIGTSLGTEIAFTTKKMELPTLGSVSIFEITYTSANCKCYHIDDGGGELLSLGFCYSTKQNPTIGDDTVKCNLLYADGYPYIETNLDNLNNGKTYYIRAYAINPKGVAYSDEKEFTTLAYGMPTVITTKISDISYKSAACGGNVTSDGGKTVWARGICYSTSQDPTLSDKKVIEGKGVGEYSCTMTGLHPGTTYYVRAYATNENGTAYGESLDFTTFKSTPVISTTEPTDITLNSAIVGGKITDTGGNEIIEKGVCWGTSHSPTWAGNHITADSESNNAPVLKKTNSNNASISQPDKTFRAKVKNVINDITGINGASSKMASNSSAHEAVSGGTFTCHITGLQKQTLYYVRAYIRTDDGKIYYGDEKSFETLKEVVLPTLAEMAVHHETATGVSCSALIASDGNSTINDAGFCWSEHDMPTLNGSYIKCETSSYVLSATISELKPETKYYIRAYATNMLGTAFSDVVEFTTLPAPTLPTVEIGEATEITSSSAIVSGEITSLGNVDSISNYGFVWSTGDNPTLENGLYIELGAATQPHPFTIQIDNLDGNTLYYCRAYATNEIGTTYSDTYTFTTHIGDVKLTTGSPTDIADKTATISGEITDTGGNEIIEKGVCWSIYSQPVIDGDHVIAASSTSSVSSPETTSVIQSKLMDAKSVSRLPQREIRGANKSLPTSITPRKAISGGSFICYIENLQPLTGYYARVYAKVADGTVYYGNEQQFTTEVEKSQPTLSLVQVNDITTTSATLTASILSDGNLIVTQAGFCWSEHDAPTLNDYYINCKTSSNFLSATIGELKSGTKYYIRAYATNMKGTGYSDVAEFTTLAITKPIVGDVMIENIGRTSAYASSQIISDGNTTLTEHGFCWSIAPNPSTYDNKVIVNSEEFYSKLTGLPELSTVYVRAYATNSIGTAYSNDVFFTTVEVDNDIWDGSIANAFEGGYGTESSPIIINTAAQLALLRDNVNKGTTYSGVYFKLTSNINLNKHAWNVIGSGNYHFDGTFDGNNMTIGGLTNNGVFGTNNGLIRNLNVTGNIISDNSSYYMSGVVITNNGIVEGCTNGVNITTSSNAIIGGICASNNGIVTNCINKGKLSGGYIVGGIIGDWECSQSTSITKETANCANIGEISNANIAGGIIGSVLVKSWGGTTSVSVKLQITNCINYADIQAGTSGGIVGLSHCIGSYTNYTHAGHVLYWAICSLENCCNNANIIGTEAGGLVGKITIDKYGYSYEGNVYIYNSFWLNDIVQNIGTELYVGNLSSDFASNCQLNAPSNWYLHSNSSCNLIESSDDIVTLLNNWIDLNGPTEYKKWKYEIIDGYAVPVFDE